ncbi:MAG: radical SAM protein [Mycolicibacterium sp.]|uniref:4Fe-4S single cluster domain-containing protein n=1 Tax=Mycolicibacterium sp. TaxID=2320850 RepID=UPI000F8FED95|nr:4Fe-4S single cluster domain-containing protein [Mycolicibacterium sp.]RUP32980.1 MAG: radical SAM protein [Mycolicibacterium sp.]
MRIRLSRTHFPVTALGPGRRVGIWMQGCSFACPGCVSRDTWTPDGGLTRDVQELADWIATFCATGDGVDGVTISGGEPTEQPEALHDLITELDRLRSDNVFTGDVLCYTGCDIAELLDRCPWAPGMIDAVITGRFRIELPTDLVWRGSANQEIIPLTELGRRRYAEHVDRIATSPQLQFAVTDESVWMIGIPRRGDLQRLEAALRTDGVTLQETSWRP